ncbi:MAG: hypothetical protein ABIJ40_15140 [Bacteroidota bacterium]
MKTVETVHQFSKLLLTHDLSRGLIYQLCFFETAELNFERTNELFNLGKVTLTQFREPQLNLIRSKNNITELKTAIKNLEIELLKLGGILL